jgi:hypothetical protein
MHDLIFWYTGWVVWAAIAVIVALGVIIGAIVVVARSYHLSKEWLGLKVLYARISKNEITRLREILRPIPDNINVDALLAYAEALRKRAKDELNQPLFDDEDDTKHTVSVASIFGHYDGKKPFSHWLRELIDELNELKSDAKNQVYRDQKHADYLQSLLECSGDQLLSKFDPDIVDDIVDRLRPSKEALEEAKES